MTKNLGPAIVLALGTAFGGSTALAQTGPLFQNRTVPQGVPAQPAALPQIAVQPGQEQAPAQQNPGTLHPQYEAALVAEAQKKGGTFDPAGKCAGAIQLAAQGIGQNRITTAGAAGNVQGQAAGIVKGWTKEFGQSGGVGRSILGEKAHREVQIAQHNNAQQDIVCKAIAENNGYAWGGNLNRALSTAYSLATRAQAAGMVEGLSGTGDKMRDRSNDDMINRLPIPQGVLNKKIEGLFHK